MAKNIGHERVRMAKNIGPERVRTAYKVEQKNT